MLRPVLKILASAIAALASLGASAQVVPELTPGDAAALHAILPEKARRGAAEHKIHDDLLMASRAARQRGAANASAHVPPFARAFVQREVAADGDVYVVVRGAVTDDLRSHLAQAGARGIAEYPAYDTVTAVVPVEALEALAAHPDVRSIGPRERFVTGRYVPHPDDPPLPPQPKVGSTNWAGIAAHQADRAHAAGFTGAGTKLCVLSDGIDSLAGRVSAGELPASVGVLSGQAGAGDEGTAMLELAHDMAPGAALAFATADGGTAQFASNIVALRTVLNCDVIVDDVLYFTEGAFQDSAVAQAVNTVTSMGALYFSAAGNSGSVAKNTSSTYERDFVAATNAVVPAAIASYEGGPVALHSFAGQPYTTLTRSTSYVVLHWGERLSGSASDYDLFVTDSTGTNILGAPGASSQTGSQDAVEVAWCDKCSFPAGSRVYVVKYSGQARALRLNAVYGRLAHFTNGSVFGHAGTTGAIAVGAVRLSTAGGGSFSGGSANPVETFSSDGPRRFFFTPGGGEITPGNTLIAGNGGTVVAKVDIAASDCGATTTPGFASFCGTSAAAPSAAALAALVRSASPAASAAQVKSALVASALDIEAGGIDVAAGAGIPMAAAAIRSTLANIMVAKSFLPAAMAVGGTAVLSIQLNNPNTVAIAGVGFQDSYPSPLRNAPSPGATISGSGCSGTLAASPGGNDLVLTNGRIPAGSVCTYSVTVTSPAVATVVDASGTVTTPIGLDSPGFSARLDVGTLPGAPTGVTATPGNRQITVAFTPPANTGGLPLTAFAIACTPSDGGSPVELATSSLQPTVVAPLVNGTQYVCTVAAHNAIGGGPVVAAPATAPMKSDQAITFTSVAPAPAYVGGPPYVVTAQGSAGGTPTFSVDAASAAACAISGGVVSFIGVGTCSIHADLAGNDALNPAPQATQAVPVVVATTLVADVAQLAFGGQSMGTRSPALSVTIGNYTVAPITVSGVAVSGPFTQSHACATLLPGATCTVLVTFAPGIGAGPVGTTEAATGSLNVTAAAGGSLAPVALGGTGEKSLVTHFYRSILNRPADAAGKSYWESEALRLAGLGVDLNETWYVMAGYFFNSAEYTAAGKDNAAYVADLYNTFFNRAPDAAGLAYWVGQVEGGLPREVVLFSFMFSDEFRAFTRAIFGETAARPEVNLVMDFFRGVLNRLPDTASLDYWVGRLRTAQCAGPTAVLAEVDAMSAAFIFNAEYNNRGRDNTRFVTDMYYSFLRRGGDAAGVGYWIHELDTRARDINTVRMSFLNSPEFAARVQGVIAAGCR